MSLFKTPTATLVAAALSAVFTLTPAHATVDADAAQALFKKNECTKCHSVDKTKSGPALKKIAAKYLGKPDASDKLVKHMTTGPKVKSEDGTEELHKVIDTKDPVALKNLADWILSR
jgi:cytochrome c